MTYPSYRDVAEWLPTDIREHIEATAPCPRGGEHQWRHDSGVEFSVFGRLDTVRIGEHWYCACGLVHTTDPEKWR